MENCTALHKATLQGYERCVKLLLLDKYGALVNIVNNDCETALHIAAKNGSFNIAKILIDHNANVNAKNRENETPLSKAAKQNQLKIVQLLQRSRADVNTTNANDETPLHLASKSGHLDIVEFLVEFADLEKADKNGATAFYLASQEGHVDVVNVLLSHQAYVDAHTKDNETALQTASKNNQSNIVERLLASRADVNKADKNGYTALHWAAFYGNFEIVVQLVSKGATIDAMDQDGKTPLYWAARSNHVDILKFLVEKGASVNMIANSGYPPMHWASLFGHVEVVRELLDSGASVRTATTDGWTALHLASKECHLDILRLLLKAGADILAKNKEGKTARDVGNEAVNALIDDFVKPLNIEMAVKRINQSVKINEKCTLALVKVACTILKLCVAFQVNRQDILTTGLFVEQIVRHVMRCGPPPVEAPFSILSTLQHIQDYLENTLALTQTWKLLLDEITNHEEMKHICSKIREFQGQLVQVGEDLDITIHAKVVGNINDLKNDIGTTVDTMEKFDERLANVPSITAQQGKDYLTQLFIQMTRGLSYYNRQVALGNITEDEAFEAKLNDCIYRFYYATTLNNADHENNDTTHPYDLARRMIHLDVIDTWMISADDVVTIKLSQLGKGGFGTVYKGRYQGQDVAVKECNTTVVDSADLERDIAKEIKAWKDISNKPHILTLVGVCTKIPNPIIVTELCATNIRRYVRDHSTSLLPMIYQFAKGLLTIEEANIIHRDIKGDNVLVTFQKTVVIADFGLCRSITSLHHTNAISKGTLNWMSPEQFRESRNLTTKSDVWSFGMTVWEIVANRTPFFYASTEEFRNSIFKDNTDRPEKTDAFTPHLEPLWTLINKCWQLDPIARPSAREIVKDIESHYSSTDLEMSP
ncbi:unnamed protein product [Aphanomyces euteiches]